MDHDAPFKVQYKVIASFVAKKIRQECEIMEPNTIKEDLLRDYGIKIKDHQVLKAHHATIEMIYGGLDDSYQTTNPD